MKTESKQSESKAVNETASNDKLVMLAPSSILPNSENPRIKYVEIEELMKSILENGLKDPLTGYYKGDKVILKDGHRRMKAIQMALDSGNQIARVPVIIVSAPTKEQETLDYMIHNDGKPLTMLEQSEVIKRLLNFGWKVTDIVKKTGKARGYIENLIILTKLPMKIYNLILEDKISAHAVIQILAAVKGDEAALIEAVEEAIKAAKEAGKSKATPKHVNNKKVKGASHGKFYKFAEEILNTVSGQKTTHKQREDVLSYVMVAYENGQRAKDIAERYFTDKTKVAEVKKAESTKSPAAKTITTKKQTVKPAPKKGAHKTGKKK